MQSLQQKLLELKALYRTLADVVSREIIGARIYAVEMRLKTRRKAARKARNSN